MKDIYMIIFDDESDFLITTEPEQEIRALVIKGISYDDMRLFKGREIDFTVDFINMEVRIKEG